MDFDPDLAGWISFIKAFSLVLAGGVGVMMAGWYQAKADNKRTRAETNRHRDDHEIRRSHVESTFMEGLLQRVTALEVELAAERQRYRDDMARMYREINQLRMNQRHIKDDARRHHEDIKPEETKHED